MLYRRIIINSSDGFFRDIKPKENRFRNSWKFHLLLFIATLITTTGVGSLMAGGNLTSFSGIFKGIPFSLSLLSILGVQEFAHYFAAKRWGITVTLPYFIPAPILPIGTFGAVISMKSSIPNRKALIDVGASGPIAGFIVAVIATIIGLKMSQVVPLDSLGKDFSYYYGDSLIFKLLVHITLGKIPAGYDVLLNPVAFAGWIGLFVTALNLLPIGQLDGGHIIFALSTRYHELIRRIRIPLLILLGLIFWEGWYIWAILSLFFGKAHPYPDYMETKLDFKRKFLAAFSIIVFVLCIIFIPVSVR